MSSLPPFLLFWWRQAISLPTGSQRNPESLSLTRRRKGGAASAAGTHPSLTPPSRQLSPEVTPKGIMKARIWANNLGSLIRRTIVGAPDPLALSFPWGVVSEVE